jgi:hypothetical protein
MGINCDYRISAIICLLEAWLCFGYVILNTLYKSNDNSNNNNNNNNNWEITSSRDYVKHLIINPTRCTTRNISNLFWKWNYTYFGQLLCPSSGVIHCTLSNGICQLKFHKLVKIVTNLWNVSWHISLLSVQWIPPDDGQRKCPKIAEFHFENKFEKLVHLVGFIIRKFITIHGHMNVKIRKTRLIVTAHILRNVLM